MLTKTVRSWLVYPGEVQACWSLQDAHWVYENLSEPTVKIRHIIAAMTVLSLEQEHVPNYRSVMTTMTEHIRIRLSEGE